MTYAATTLAEGEVQVAEVLYLVAFILFVLGALFCIARRQTWAIETALLFTGLALIALAGVVL